MHYNPRQKYDTFIIWLYNQKKEYLIPQEIRKMIPHSTASSWRNLNYTNYLGHQVSAIQKEAIQQYEIFENYKNLKRIVFSLTRVWIQVSVLLMPLFTKSKENRAVTVEVIQQLFQVLPRHLVFKLVAVSPTTFFNWLGIDKVKCGISPLDLCFKRHPLQLAKKEVEKIKNLFQHPDFQCWPASSIYYYALREREIYISLSTFYKYVNLLGLKRKWKKSAFESTHPLVTTKSNEFIHIDTTFWTLPSGIKAAIIFVCDNFSKTILGWNVSLKKDGENAKAALKKAVETVQKYHPNLETTSLVTDGGGENHNLLVEDFLSNLKMPEIIKLLALKEVKFSNSAVEAINKIIKRYLRKKLPNTLEELIKCIEEIVLDYNTIRPHGSLLGLTPMECYTSKTINLDFKQQKLQAKKNRIQQNKSVNCGIDVCKGMK